MTKTYGSRVFRQLSVATILVMLLFGCGGGGGNGSGGGDTSGGSAVDGESLANATISVSGSPLVGEPLTLSIDEDSNLEGVQWRVLSAPANASINLQVALDGLSAALTPEVVGDYSFGVSSSRGDSAAINIRVEQAFAFDVNKLEDYDGSHVDEFLGVILNQAWVYSDTLTEDALTALVDTYSRLRVMGYDPLWGLLVEYDNEEPLALAELEQLAASSGVDGVEPRVHEGKNVPRDDLLPNDGDAFNDGGDNWHLEKINMPEAWEYSTGSTDFMVGISDSGYQKNHEDLTGRWGVVLTSHEKDHGTESAGSIGAIANNNKGISGINWLNPLAAGLNGAYGLRAVLDAVRDGKKVKLINSSWSIPGYMSKNFNPENAAHQEFMLKKASKATRIYRRAFLRKFKDRLFIWSAGNGIGNGASNTGFYGVDSKYHSGAIHLNNSGSLSRLDNVLLVAALSADNRLYYYSNYGSTVEIASPSSYKSTKTDNGYKTYGGTSAAAPVVTGVASLIYALYPAFTPAQVKSFLVDSATEFVSERYVRPNDLADTERLSRSIPILNAESSLKAAQQYIDNLVSTELLLAKPFSDQFSVSFAAKDDDFTIEKIEWKLEHSADAANWSESDSGSEGGSVISGPLNTNAAYNRVNANITLHNSAKSARAVAKQIVDIPFATISFQVLAQQAPKSGVTVKVDRLDAADIKDQGSTDSEGFLTAYVQTGVYEFTFSLSGYQEQTKVIELDELENNTVVINLLADGQDEPQQLGSCLITRDDVDMFNTRFPINIADKDGNGIYEDRIDCYYYESGQLQFQIAYADGVRDGVSTYYTKSGELSACGVYARGEYVSDCTLQ